MELKTVISNTDGPGSGLQSQVAKGSKKHQFFVISFVKDGIMAWCLGGISSASAFSWSRLIRELDYVCQYYLLKTSSNIFVLRFVTLSGDSASST